MKRKIELLLLALVILLTSGCNSIQKLKNIRVTSATIDSVTPTGFRSLDAKLLIGLDNPAMQFTIEDVSGVLYYKAKPYVDFSAEPVTVKAKTAAVYELNASAFLKPEVTLLEVMRLAKNYDLADFTIDINATVKLRSGVGKALTFKDMNLKDLME